MKTHKLLAALVAFSSASVISAEPGSDHSPDDNSEWAELFGDASLAVVWQSAAASAESIATAVAARKSDGVAAWAETIHLAAHALIDQVKMPEAARKQRLDAALGQAAKLADEVLDGAQHNELDQTAAAFKRLQSALALAKIRLPKEIVEATSEAPRFAKTPEHDDGHKH